MPLSCITVRGSVAEYFLKLQTNGLAEMVLSGPHTPPAVPLLYCKPVEHFGLRGGATEAPVTSLLCSKDMPSCKRLVRCSTKCEHVNFPVFFSANRYLMSGT